MVWIQAILYFWCVQCINVISCLQFKKFLSFYPNYFTFSIDNVKCYFVLCTTVQQKHSHTMKYCTCTCAFNILLWIKTVLFDCKLSCISLCVRCMNVISRPQFKELISFYPNYFTFSTDKVKWTNKWCDKRCICTPV